MTVNAAPIQTSGHAGHAGHTRSHLSHEGSKTGMWLFLYTEILLFGGLFLIYSVYRYLHAADFSVAAAHLNVPIGVINTVVLLTSSLTMALSVTALQRDQRSRSMNMLMATIALSGLFLVFKFFEWKAKYEHGTFPGMEHLNQLPNGEKLFFTLYFTMTGLHAVHVIIGLAVMAVVWQRIRKGTVTVANYPILEYTGLYWHIVDLIWIFLLPLFYLTN